MGSHALTANRPPLASLSGPGHSSFTHSYFQVDLNLVARFCSSLSFTSTFTSHPSTAPQEAANLNPLPISPELNRPVCYTCLAATVVYIYACDYPPEPE